MRTYHAPMIFRPIFAILIALAVLLAPTLSASGEASASTGDHHSQTMDDSHCQPGPESHDEDKAAGDPCCVSMCMGVAVPQAAPDRSAGVAVAPELFPVPALHLSHLAEIATPPPRFA